MHIQPYYSTKESQVHTSQWTNDYHKLDDYRKSAITGAIRPRRVREPNFDTWQIFEPLVEGSSALTPKSFIFLLCVLFLLSFPLFFSQKNEGCAGISGAVKKFRKFDLFGFIKTHFYDVPNRPPSPFRMLVSLGENSVGFVRFEGNISKSTSFQRYWTKLGIIRLYDSVTYG